MAIIELNVERPALKRTEVVGDEDIEEVAEDAPVEVELDEADAESEEETSNSGGTVRRTVSRAALLGVAVVGLLTFKKLRSRGKGGDADEDADE